MMNLKIEIQPFYIIYKKLRSVVITNSCSFIVILNGFLVYIDKVESEERRVSTMSLGLMAQRY